MYIVFLLLGIALAAYLLTGVYRIRDDEVLYFVKCGKIKSVSKGWHYRLPILYVPWKRIKNSTERIDYVSNSGEKISLDVKIIDAETYYKKRYDVHSVIEKSLKQSDKEKALKEGLFQIGLEATIRP